MTLTIPPSGAWELAGARAARLLDAEHAVVIAARDPVTAAQAAIGLARVQGERRRVAIGDLVGDVPPLQQLVATDDPHGLVDSFLYGVSLNRIARPVGADGNVFVLPSGTEAVAQDAVYRSDRWRRLAAGFQQVGALLLLVALPEAPGFADLCAHVGTVLPVGTWRPVVGPGVRVLDAISRDTPPAGTPRLGGGSAAPALGAPPHHEALPGPGQGAWERGGTSAGGADAVSAGLPAGAAATPTGGATGETSMASATPSVARARAAAAVPADARRWRLVAGLLVVGALAVAAGAFWPSLRGRLPAPLSTLLAGGGRRGSAAELFAADSTRPLAADSVQVLQRDGAPPGRGDSTPVAAAPEPPVPEVANPGDSARAARFAVYAMKANTPELALGDARLRRLPAVALSPVPEDGVRWIRVTVGAAVSRAEAESLLVRLRREALVDTAGRLLVEVPYALRLETGVPAAAREARLADWARRGLVAYALRQPDGSATLYTGAFETPRQAAGLADSLRAAGIAAPLVHRTGSVF